MKKQINHRPTPFDFFTIIVDHDLSFFIFKIFIHLVNVEADPTLRYWD
jgi:hypothetical protein